MHVNESTGFFIAPDENIVPLIKRFLKKLLHSMLVLLNKAGGNMMFKLRIFALC
jgi:hypothetical protein